MFLPTDVFNNADFKFDSINIRNLIMKLKKPDISVFIKFYFKVPFTRKYY